tara:strand:+ start:202 stop:420 length:219 start_codon:yes stop_codon:yes gene_type:complete
MTTKKIKSGAYKIEYNGNTVFTFRYENGKEWGLYEDINAEIHIDFRSKLTTLKGVKEAVRFIYSNKLIDIIV